MRSLILLIVQNVLHFQIGARLFRHLIRLPIAYFEKRHIGDILSRFTSIEPIRMLLAEGMIAAMIDGLMAVATLAMIFVYSTQLALVVLSGLCALCGRASRALPIAPKAQLGCDRDQGPRELDFHRDACGRFRASSSSTARASAKSQWLNRYAEVVSANVRLGRTKIAFTTINDAALRAGERRHDLSRGQAGTRATASPSG